MSEKQNQNQKNVNTTEQQVQQEVPQQQPEQQVQQVQPQVVVVQKEGFGSWLKRHWKGVVAGLTGTLAVGTSAVVAYKKGKSAGTAAAYQQNDDDYSLNPNE